MPEVSRFLGIVITINYSVWAGDGVGFSASR